MAQSGRSLTWARGRKAVLIASTCGFKRMSRVEPSPELAAIADTNVERYLRRHPNAAPIEVACADTTEYPFPRDPVSFSSVAPQPVEGQILVVASHLAESVRAWPCDVVVLYQSRAGRKRGERRPVRVRRPATPLKRCFRLSARRPVGRCACKPRLGGDVRLRPDFSGRPHRSARSAPQ
jgi:hypothetical protein